MEDDRHLVGNLVNWIFGGVAAEIEFKLSIFKSLLFYVVIIRYFPHLNNLTVWYMCENTFP